MTYGKSGRRMRREDERIRLEGLVERPIVTEEEFEWMRQHLKVNQELALKSTKLRDYLSKGMVHCAAGGRRYNGLTVIRRGKAHSYYVCAARWKRRPHDKRCRSGNFNVDVLEQAVYRMGVDFLDPEAVELLRQRLVSRSAAAKPNDRRFILEAIGARVIVQPTSQIPLWRH